MKPLKLVEARLTVQAVVTKLFGGKTPSIDVRRLRTSLARWAKGTRAPQGLTLQQRVFSLIIWTSLCETPHTDLSMITP